MCITRVPSSLFRVIILRKKPTLLKIIAAGIVLLGLILSLIPVITGMDKSSAKGKAGWLSQPTLGRILWPLCFMIGFVSTCMYLIRSLLMQSTITCYISLHNYTVSQTTHAELKFLYQFNLIMTHNALPLMCVN